MRLSGWMTKCDSTRNSSSMLVASTATSTPVVISSRLLRAESITSWRKPTTTSATLRPAGSITGTETACALPAASGMDVRPAASALRSVGDSAGIGCPARWPLWKSTSPCGDSTKA